MTNRDEAMSTRDDRTNDWAVGWQFRALCRGEESSLFFAPNYFERKEQKEAREALAKAICARCPVRSECLEYALRIREPHGIWGGLNEYERRALLRARGQRLEAG
jgi:WhiB family transcriptional regulator, redox-sensing transcriptional regulator